MKYTPNLTRREQTTGLITLLVCLFLLPGLLARLLPDLSPARLNFTAYFITAGSTVYVLRRYLLQNLLAATARPFGCVYYAALGYLGCTAMVELVNLIIAIAAPGFINHNNQTITSMLDTDFGLMVVTTVALAPIAEECLFRGLLFRGVYDRSPFWAWALSMSAFSAIHLMAFIGTYTPMELLLAFIQYLPAGLALCFAYQRGGSIFSPILTHALVNAMAAWSVTR